MVQLTTPDAYHGGRSGLGDRGPEYERIAAIIATVPELNREGLRRKQRVQEIHVHLGAPTGQFARMVFPEESGAKTTTPSAIDIRVLNKWEAPGIIQM